MPYGNNDHVLLRTPTLEEIRTRINPSPLYENLLRSVEALQNDVHADLILDECVPDIFRMLNEGTMKREYVHSYPQIRERHPAVARMFEIALENSITRKYMDRLVCVEYPFSPRTEPEQPKYYFIMWGMISETTDGLRLEYFDPLDMVVRRRSEVEIAQI